MKFEPEGQYKAFECFKGMKFKTIFTRKYGFKKSSLIKFLAETDHLLATKQELYYEFLKKFNVYSRRFKLRPEK